MAKLLLANGAEVVVTQTYATVVDLIPKQTIVKLTHSTTGKEIAVRAGYVIMVSQ